LRQALFSLRQTIGDSTAQPPYLRISRDEIQFNAASAYVLDAASFDLHLAARASHTHVRLNGCATCAGHLQQATDLYRGKFLHELLTVICSDSFLLGQPVEGLLYCRLDHDRKCDVQLFEFLDIAGIGCFGNKNPASFGELVG
jgi:hypothetical protein